MIVAGTNNVNIPRSTLLITGATESKTPTCTPKNDTNTNTVPVVKNADTSWLVMFNNPTTTPNKKTTHSIVAWYLPVNPNPSKTARIKPTRKDQAPMRWDLSEPFPAILSPLFQIQTIRKQMHKPSILNKIGFSKIFSYKSVSQQNPS